MAKTLSFTDTSPQTVKIGDTTTSFTLICGDDNVATDLTNVTSITVKLGNTSGYLKSATVDPTSLTDPTTGQVTVNFNADLMTSLTAGSYAIEVWVVDSTGTSIYPSDGTTGFTITNNIQSTNGTTITTITFDDFVAAMNKAASTIAKGDKGDKGDTGPQGVMTNDQVNTLIDNKIKYTSGNLDVTPAFYKAGTTSSTGALNYVRTGNKLHVSGVVSPSADLAIGSATTLFNLPSSIGIIAENVAVVQQSSGWNLYCLSWNPNGAVSVLKHNIAGTATAITTTTQLQVCADILIK
ncbi:putative Prophage Lp2 protein 53 [Lactiplantibacillus plantarum]|uniref:hypothetical protein n=1 Tax=Lactiplantibacillus plantarum TaxID=1590 RepID=UPI0007EE209C|nr:hypothetical protein [Lactiplantibacillus plantarum]ANM75123.1 hypothetical protein A8P51_12205 [Lactiplantibacillus plantarum]KAA4798474.1 hypothetical protein F2048_23395 [Bacteroides fragilis]MCG0666736.1 putative Prophage Lp2 protein 53 [Lactiplantibacillus plantarum]MDN7042323.1 hypothetical protein [Lactiplantibacillus plantarum]